MYTADRAPASLAEMAYAKVKERIILNEYRGGQTLDEASLARQLELTRTPVREAVQRLAHEGLLRIIPRRGTMVTEPTIDQMRQVFEARTPCEVQIVRLAAMRAEPGDVKELEASLAGIDTLIEQRRFRELLVQDQRFHLRVAKIAGNQLLEEFYIRVYSLGIRLWYSTLPQRPAHEIKSEMHLHRDVAKAIRTHDPDFAERAILTVIGGFPERVSDLIRRTATAAA